MNNKTAQMLLAQAAQLLKKDEPLLSQRILGLKQKLAEKEVQEKLLAVVS